MAVKEFKVNGHRAFKWNGEPLEELPGWMFQLGGHLTKANVGKVLVNSGPNGITAIANKKADNADG